MLSLIGDETEDIINLPNGMVIKIDYGDNDLNSFGVRGRYTSKHRRVRLFDKKEKVITELIEDNPHKENVPVDAFDVEDSSLIL